LQDRINQHISKSIRNNQKPTKILPKQKCKEKINPPKSPQCNSAIGSGVEAGDAAASTGKFFWQTWVNLNKLEKIWVNFVKFDKVWAKIKILHPKNIRSPTAVAIGLHFLQNKECANNDQQIFILARAISAFHISALEATYIKTLKPILCLQKEFVYFLQISH